MWNEVKSIVSRYYGEWEDMSYEGAITTMLPKTALLGNGDVGITSYGNNKEKIFLISKGDFWTYKGGPILIGGVTIGVPADVEDADLDDNVETPKFYEKQDILNAEIQTIQRLADVPVKMLTWLSADKNILVTELTSVASEDEVIWVKTWASENDISVKPVSAFCDAETVTVTRCTANIGKGTVGGHVSQAALSTKIIGADDVSTSVKIGSGNLQFTLRKDTTVYIVTAVAGGGRTYKSDGATFWDETVMLPEIEAKNLLAEVTGDEAVQVLNFARLEWWKNFWCASYIDFGTEDDELNSIQKYYYGAQYLLGSTSRKGKVAPGLYGNWHTTDAPRWMSDYHMNYNFIATFYGTNSSNRPELSLPGVQALLDYVPQAQENASRISELTSINSAFVNKKRAEKKIDFELGIKGGVLFPVGIGPWGMDVYSSYYWGQLLDAAFNTYLMTDYYDSTMDTNFLENGVYDFLKKVVTFYEAWLEKEESVEAKDGYEYVMYSTYKEGLVADSWGRNASVELSALKNTISHLIKYSKLLDKDADKRPVWIDIYEHLGTQPTIEVNGKTVLALTEKAWDGEKWVQHTDPSSVIGGVVPLESMIPGNIYHYFSSKEEIQLLHDTIDLYSSKNGWAQMNNFPRIFTQAVNARYDIEIIIAKFAEVINAQMSPNLSIQDRVHGVEKIGATKAVNSMLLISKEGITKVFPNWLANKDAKFVNLRAGGAFVVSANYNAKTREAENITIISEAGKDMTLVLPWKEGATVKDSIGNVIETQCGTVPNWKNERTLVFKTTAGETYTIEKGWNA